MSEHREVTHEKVVHWTEKIQRQVNDYKCWNFPTKQVFKESEFDKVDKFIEELLVKDNVFNVFLEEIETRRSVKIIKGCK